MHSQNQTSILNTSLRFSIHTNENNSNAVSLPINNSHSLSRANFETFDCREPIARYLQNDQISNNSFVLGTIC